MNKEEIQMLFAAMTMDIKTLTDEELAEYIKNLEDFIVKAKKELYQLERSPIKPV